MGFTSTREANMPSVSVKDVSQQAFTVALAAHFKKTGKMKVPEWVDLVKTNVGKELAPYDEDWYFVRSLHRQTHLRQVSRRSVHHQEDLWHQNESRQQPLPLARGSRRYRQEGSSVP